MECKKVKKTFKVVSIKGSGAFTDFATEVPKLAQQFLARLDEIETNYGSEIAIFEPKKDANHLEGKYYAGVIMNETLSEVPIGMEYIELDQDYVTTRGNINTINKLHSHLLKWSNDKGYKRKLETFIVETYHPMENGQEEVEIYLPIHI